MSFLLIVLAVLAVAGAVMLINAYYSAPEAYEDEQGFHLAAYDPDAQKAS